MTCTFLYHMYIVNNNFPTFFDTSGDNGMNKLPLILLSVAFSFTILHSTLAADTKPKIIPKLGQRCSKEGETRCGTGSQFQTCDHGTWVTRFCPPDTTCRNINGTRAYCKQN